MPEINITKDDIAAALDRIESAPWSNSPKIDELVRGRGGLDHIVLAVIEGARLLANVLADPDGLHEEAIASEKAGIVARVGLTQIMSELAKLDDRRK